MTLTGQDNRGRVAPAGQTRSAGGEKNNVDSPQGTFVFYLMYLAG